MTIDTAVAVILIPAIISAVVTLGTKYLSRRTERATATRDEGEAAIRLSEAAAKQIETYNDEIVAPLRERIAHLEAENESLRKVLTDVNSRSESLRRSYNEQIESLQSKVRDMEKTLDSQREQIAILIEQSATKDLTIRRMQEEIEQLRRENADLRYSVDRLKLENDLLKEKK